MAPTKGEFMHSIATDSSSTKRRFHGLLAVAIVIVVAATGLLAVPAGATTDGATHTGQAGVLACRQYNDHTNAYSPDGGGYWYPSDMNHRVPIESTCRDIQVWIHPSDTEGCGFFRVRFIGQGSTDPRLACWDHGFVILATNVVNETLYRVETLGRYGSRHFTVMD
jgi:hypothetical protein